MFWAEEERAQGRSGIAVQMQTDISKMYDNIRFERLWNKGKEYGFPLSILRLDIATYRWQRRLVSQDGIVSRRIWPGRGLAAGSGRRSWKRHSTSWDSSGTSRSSILGSPSAYMWTTLCWVGAE